MNVDMYEDLNYSLVILVFIMPDPITDCELNSHWDCSHDFEIMEELPNGIPIWPSVFYQHGINWSERQETFLNDIHQAQLQHTDFINAVGFFENLQLPQLTRQSNLFTSFPENWNNNDNDNIEITTTLHQNCNCNMCST
jgi:hypothetical protein